MKSIINLIVFHFLIVQIVAGQTIDQDESCNCDIILTVPDLVSTSQNKGDLFEFVKFDGKERIRTVAVQLRTKNGFEQDSKSKNIHDVFRIYNRWIICLQGHFVADQTIELKGLTTIKLLQGTTIKYLGDGAGPLFDIRNLRIAIKGSSGAQLITEVPMRKGMIRIKTDRTKDNLRVVSDNLGTYISNASFAQIKDIKIINISPEPDLPITPLHHAKNNRAIVLDNPVESINNLTENSDNYWAQLSNLEIEGFSTGIHLRGWSNVATIRNISFKNIYGYGIWLSGCVDNSIAEVQFENCPAATAIRLDNYVNEIYKEFSIGGKDYSLKDPNQRISFSVKDIVTKIFSGLEGSTDIVKDLRAKIGLTKFSFIEADYFTEDPLGYALLKESCNWKTTFKPGNKISRFGFFYDYIDSLENEIVIDGFEIDDPSISPKVPRNYQDDKLGLLDVWNNTIEGESKSISLYNSSFKHKNGMPIKLVNGATCKDTAVRFSNFFLPPAYNAFSRIQVVGVNGNLEVANLVEVAQREDGKDLCLEVAPRTTDVPKPECMPCTRDFKGKISSAFGSRNTIIFCSLPENVHKTSDGIIVDGSTNDFVINNLYSGCGLSFYNAVRDRYVPIVEIFSEN
ncbi:hypothetical protein N9L92_02295 [Saprospiraceae bacterium]|nr:hypothetical protein [Saprospiraceae bacterium]